ncbi:hypothetical protein RFI_17023, partial [Reticulomyxa filosa]
IVSGYVQVIPYSKIKIYNLNSDDPKNKPKDVWPHLQYEKNRKSSAFKKNRHSTLVSNDPSDDGMEDYAEIEPAKAQDNTIGKGATSKVYRGRYGKQDVAVKCLLRMDNRSEMNWTDLTLLFRESILSSSLSHPNIVKFIGASLTYQSFYLVYEYCVYGNLQQVLAEGIHHDHIPQLQSIEQRLLFLLDIANGMHFLHQHSFVHRDLKTANVVVNFDLPRVHAPTPRFVAKICDFGVTRKVQKALLHVDEHKSESNSQSPAKSRWSISSHSSSVARENDPLEHLLQKHDRGYYIYIYIYIHICIRIYTYMYTYICMFVDVCLFVMIIKDPEWERRRLQRKKEHAATANASIDHTNPEKILRPSPYQKHQEENDEKEEKQALAAISENDASDVRSPSPTTIRTKERLPADQLDPKVLSDFKTDVFSFGMCMWCVITCKIPYQNFEARHMISMIFKQERLGIPDSIWEEWDDVVDKIELKKLLDSCWSQYPISRPSFDHIYQVLHKLYANKYTNDNRISDSTHDDNGNDDNDNDDRPDSDADSDLIFKMRAIENVLNKKQNKLFQLKQIKIKSSKLKQIIITKKT